MGGTVRGVHMNRSLRWGFANQLPRRVQVVDQALQAFGSGPMNNAEREVFARVLEDWTLLRSGLGALAERIRTRDGLPLDPKADLAKLLENQERMNTSLATLIHQIGATYSPAA
jgi:hypothetical protein